MNEPSLSLHNLTQCAFLHDAFSVSPSPMHPCMQCRYEEYIHIDTEEGQFRVPIQAQLPRADLSLPDSLKFGMTAVQDSLTVNFELSNIGCVFDYLAI